MAKVAFRKMNQEEFRRYLDEGVGGYTATLIDGRNLDRETAKREAKRTFYGMFPDGLSTKEQYNTRKDKENQKIGMFEVKRIDENRSEDIHLPNEPFELFGRMAPRYSDGRWDYTVERFDTVSEMCFPDENYDYEEMKADCVFLGAYDGDKCVGLAILQRGFFKYLYLYDLKVNKAYRGNGVGKLLIAEAKKVALEKGYRGVYTIGQDNNLAACLFYIRNGFRIGGFDTEVYNGTSQEGKADIIFYLD